MAALRKKRFLILGVVHYTILYYGILYDTIQYRAGGPGGSSPLENCKISILGVVAHIILYYMVLYYIMLTIPNGWSRERQPPRKLQDFNSGSGKLYCIILYCIVLYYTKPNAGKTARFHLWELQNILYHIILH